MNYYVYILQSESSGRYYCGQTSNLGMRLEQHNDPEYKLTRTTKVFKGPWKLAWHCQVETRSEAMKMEKAIKRRGIGRFLNDARVAESRPRRD
jgi:putative endonuclease